MGLESFFGENARKKQNDYKSIMFKAVADRLAEAFAEWLHELVRKEFWGYAREETLSHEEMIQCKYRGITSLRMDIQLALITRKKSCLF